MVLGGAINIQGQTEFAFGSGSYIRAVASNVSSFNQVSKIAINGLTGSTQTYRFTVRFGQSSGAAITGGSGGTVVGDWYLMSGLGTTFSERETYTANDIFAHIRFQNLADGTFVIHTRNAGTWTYRGILFQGVDYQVELLVNTSNSTQNYTRGTAQSVAAWRYDLWVNGTLYENDGFNGTSTIPLNGALTGFAIMGSNSGSNNSNIFIDDIQYSNIVTDPTALPVELTSFASTSNGNAITLNWATATEVDNYGFEVERSADNTTFTKVGFVAGAGNSNVQKQYTFVDENLVAGTYYYRLKQVDTDGSFEYSQVVSSSVSETPATFSLDQNYPNPFNPSTKISFALAKESDVKLSVFNTLGEEVAVLINSTLTAGNHSVDFNASNLTSGLYFYKLQAGSFVATNKMVLTK